MVPSQACGTSDLLTEASARLARETAELDGWTQDLHQPIEELRCELDTLVAAVDRIGMPRLLTVLDTALDLLSQAHRCMGKQLFLPALCCAVAARQALRRLRVSVRLTLR